MTLHLHRSNDLDRLVESLARLPALVPADPFEPETIVLQTRGMERWLSMRLAQARGVFAHGRFVAFDDLLHELMAELVPAERADDWRPGQLVWRIAEVLRTAPGDPELSAIAAWLDSTHTDPGSLALALPDQIVQLAWRIAEVFFRYAIHRPDKVDGWEQGGAEPGQEWQPALWRRLAERIGAPHPGRRMTTLIERLADAPLPAGFPRRLVLFGHHTMVRLQVRALAALGRRMEVHLFRPAIGPGLGHDKDVRKHPLRASLGRLLDHFDQLLSEEAPDAVRDDSGLSAPADKTLLGRLQCALYHGPAREDLRRGGAAEVDPSLQFHSCASSLRQVEVLRDELLSLFAGDETLEPRDVIVMTPDMETYAPLIDAVFRDGDKDLPPDNPMSAGFPPIHRLHDLALRRTNPIAESFLAILGLALGRYPLSAVLDLLTLPPVLAKAGLLEDELPRLQDLLREAKIRWGRDEHHRADEAQPATRRNTWAGGFDRLLLGHALATTGLDDFLGIVPVDDVEGKDETRTLGLFVDYVERLFDELSDLHRPRTVAAWRARLSELVTNLLVADDASAGQAQMVFDVLNELATRAERGGFSGALEFPAMRSLIAEPLEARRPSVSFLSGGLTFCTLVPMRTIPFRVVCLLGMDDGSFPRSPHGLGFDLLEGESEPGDRSPREDDRMTFIETLLAARDHLLVTWTGYRATDKRELDAAGPVAELIESVRRGLGLPKLPEPVLVSHPLQPFTPANFRSPPKSFDRRYLRGAERILQPREKLPPHWDGALDVPTPSVVALSDLAFSFEQPGRWFCKERLRVSLTQRDLELTDREPISLDQLERWSLREKVLGWVLDAVDPEHRLRALEATGVLPLGSAGRLVLQQVEDEVHAIAERVRLLRAEASRGANPPAHPDPIEVNLRLSGVDLLGQLDAVYGDSRIVYQAGKLKMKSVVSLWVRHLALCASLRAPAFSHVVAQDKHGLLRPVAPARARALLTDLLALQLRARRRPLCFFPATSWAWLEGRPATPGGPRDTPKEARDEWRRRGYDGGDDLGDGTDPHVMLLFGEGVDDFPFDDTEFMTLSEDVLGPLRETPGGRAGMTPNLWVYQSEDLS